jgi:group I intron endonuclease
MEELQNEEIIEKTAEEDRRWCVYIHTNKTNNKVYVGITSKEPKDRWGHNGNHYRQDKQPVFYNAIRLYGWDAFEHIIFAEHLTETEAKHMEILLIALYKSNCRRYKDPEYGYNMTDGGDGATGNTLSEETKQKLRECQIKRFQNPEERERLSLLAKERFKDPTNHPRYGARWENEKHPMYGKHHTEEAKKKNSESHKKENLSLETRQKMSSAKKDKTTWNKGVKYDEHRIEQFRKSHGEEMRAVMKFDKYGKLVVIYESTREAARQTGVSNTAISYRCKTRCKDRNGETWMYQDEYEQNVKKFNNND